MSASDIKMDSRDIHPESSSPPTTQPGYPDSHFSTRPLGAQHQLSSNGVGGGQGSPVLATPPSLPHGYGDPPGSENELHIHPELRSALKRAATRKDDLDPELMPLQQQQPPPPPGDAAGLSHAGSGDLGDGRKAKRELSQSKRAAQNRAAQRAFRQRKEVYIKKLEQEVRDYTEMENSHKAVQAENYALREYIISLQSRLLDAHGEYPQPPPNVNLAHPHIGPPPVAQGGSDPGPQNSAPGAGTSLEAVAQAVAGLSRSEELSDGAQYAARAMRQDDVEGDSRSNEGIGRQLQPDSIPPAPM